MTLIVGIKCEDGIVVGSDGAATLGAMGQQTVRQTFKKIAIAQDCCVVGTSGPIGISQRILGVVDQMWNKKAFSGKAAFEVMTLLRKELWTSILLAEVQAATQVKNLIGQPALVSALCACVIAMPVQHELRLFSFDQNLAPEESSDDLPFIAIGSGQSIADPFLAFLRRIFWEKRPPNLAEGVFTTWWALQHAVKTAPGGIADPKQIVVLERLKDGFVARELDTKELHEHEVAVGQAEDYLRSFMQYMSTDGEVQDIPKMEPPNSR